MSQIDEIINLLEYHRTTNTFARNAQGRTVHPHSTSATCWCALGAIAKVKQIGVKADNFQFFNLLRRDSLICELAQRLGHDSNYDKAFAVAMHFDEEPFEVIQTLKEIRDEQAR